MLLAALAVRSPAGRDAAAGAEAGAPASGIVLLDRLTSTATIGSTLPRRLENWRAGLLAFAERPLLGWGPENYMVAAARHDRTGGEHNRAKDRAHNLAVGKAATEGLTGLAVWLALWAATAAAAWRAATRLAPADAALAAFAAAALLGWFVQGMTAFYDAVSWLTHAVLVAFLAHAAAARPPEDASREAALRVAAGKRPAWTARALRLAARPWVRGLLCAGAVALAAGSIRANHAIHAGAAALYRAEYAGPFMTEIERSIRAFAPMATYPRALLFENVAANWAVIHGHDPDLAGRLIARAQAEAFRALDAEPENWQLHHALAKMYTAVAATLPAHESSARFFRQRSRLLAPYQDPLMPGKPRHEPPRGRR